MDSLVWLPEKNGTYSTRSGYAIAKAQLQVLPNDHFNWKKHVWNVKTPPKLQNFLWKVKRKALPVGTNLTTRGITVATPCKRCGLVESELHILLTCPFASSVWDLIPALHKPHDIPEPTLDTFFIASHRMLLLPPIGIFVPLHPWIAWQLWKARNTLIFDNRSLTKEEVLSNIITNAREWQDAQHHNRAPLLHIHDRPPPPSSPNTYACYVDAAWLASSSRCGMGWCFLDPHGSEIAQGSATHPYASSALMSEALALKTALEAAPTLEIFHINMFSDSQTLISLLTSNGEINELKSVLGDIRRLMETFSSISFYHVPRGNNTVADRLAKHALSF